MLGREHLELSDKLGVATELQVRLDELNLRGQPTLDQPGELVPVLPLQRHIRERMATPERHCPSTKLDGVARDRALRTSHKLLELEEVEGTGARTDPVAG